MASYCLSNMELKSCLLYFNRGILVQNFVISITGIPKAIAQDFMTVKCIEAFSEMEDNPLCTKLTQKKVTNSIQTQGKPLDLGRGNPRESLSKHGSES